MENTEHIVVTINTDEVRSNLHSIYERKGLELVNSSPTSIVWRWYNAPATDLEEITGAQGYKGSVRVS